MDWKKAKERDIKLVSCSVLVKFWKHNGTPPIIPCWRWRRSGLCATDPIFHFFSTPLGSGLEKDCIHHMVSKTRGIITLYRHQRAAFAITSKRGPAPKAPKNPTTELPPGSSICTDSDEVLRAPGVHFSHSWITSSKSCFTLYVPISRARSRFLFRGGGRSSLWQRLPSTSAQTSQSRCHTYGRTQWDHWGP